MNKLSKTLAVVAATALVGAVGVPVVANASATTNVAVEDSFNDVKYANSYDEKKWTVTTSDATNPSIKQAGTQNTCAIINKTNGTQVLLGTADRIHDISSVELSFKIDAEDGKWFAINFAETDDLEGYLSANNNAKWDGFLYTRPFMMYKSYFGGGSALSGSVSYADLLGLPANEIVGEWLKLKIVPDTADERKAKLYLAFRNDEEYSNPVDLTFPEGRSFRNAVVTLGAEGGGTPYIDDFRIVGKDGDGETVDICETFTSTILDENFRKYKRGSSDGFELFDNNKLELTSLKKGDRMVSATSLVCDDSVVSSLEAVNATFIVKFDSEAADTEEVAFFLGLKDRAGDPLKGSYAFVMTKNGGRLEKYGENGKETLTLPNTVNFDKVTSSNGSTITLSVYKDGTLRVYENGVEVSGNFDLIDTVEGYFGFVGTADNSSTIELDNVIVNNIVYFVPVTKSVTHNFSNDFFGNEGYEDFYLKQGDAGKMLVENGKLVYQGLSEQSFFGSAHQYDDFILDYKLCDIYIGTSDVENKQKTQVGTWLGLQIRRTESDLKASAATFYSEETYANFRFLIVPSDSQDECQLFCPDKLDGKKLSVTEYKKIPSSLFRAIQYDGNNVTQASIKAADAVCVRFVAEKGTLSFYLKKASEAEFTKYYSVSGVNTSGYIGLSCPGYTYCSIDDFSMANTSSVYICADNEEPETIVETEKEIIYDRGAVDVNYDDEQKLNQKKGCSGGVGTASVATLAFGAFAFALKKKNKK